MLAPKFFFGLVFSLSSSVSSDGDFYQVKACCIFKGPNFIIPEYILVSSFNKQEMMEYNSTRGYWIGFTSYSIRAAEIWNSDTNDAESRKIEKSVLCDNSVHFIQNLGAYTTAPSITLKTVIPSDGEHPAMLVCSAFNFYPKQIQLTWLRNGQEVSEGVSHSDAIAVGDFYYQIYSHLEYTPVSEETITCMIQHASLSKPRLVNLNDSLSVEEKLQIGVGVCGLLLGLIILSSGFLYYKKTSAVYSTVDQGQAVNNGTNLPNDGAL